MTAKAHKRAEHTRAARTDPEQVGEAVPLYASESENAGWPSPERLRNALRGLLGLLIHALADGIALGASAGSGDASLRIVVVLAIMVHKAPTSIGTCTLLMSRQLQHTDIRWVVLVFSLATPVGALATYGAISVLLRVVGEAEKATINPREVGAILSFSGGTFLYVAIHAVLELTTDPSEMAGHATHAHHPHDHDHPIHARAASPAPPAVSGVHVQVPLHENVLSSRPGQCLLLVVVGSIMPRLLQLVLGDQHGGH